MTKQHTKLWSLAAAVTLATLGCNELIQSKLQTEVDRIWSSPSKKVAAEEKLETLIKAKVDEELKGTYFEVPGPNPYLHHVKSMNVGIGDFGPEVTIPGTPKFWATSTHYYLEFEWAATWKRGNQAKLDMGLDLRTRKWWLANEYPDHTVKIRDIYATGNGKALVVAPKSGGVANASFTITAASIDLDADAKGWFWTVDISKQIKGQVNDQLLRQLVGKSFERAFNADVPGI